jgi:hypothetical protein
VVKGVNVLSAVVKETLEMKKKLLDELAVKQKQVKKLERSPKSESEKEAKKPEAEQKAAAEAGGSEADLTETGRGKRSREQNKEDGKRIVRDRTLKERLGSPVLPAAGETSGAMAGGTQQLSRLAYYTIPRAVSPVPKDYIETPRRWMAESSRLRRPCRRRCCSGFCRTPAC